MTTLISYSYYALIVIMRLIQAIWSRDDSFVTETGGLRFKSRAGQIGHTVADGSPPLQHCVLQRSCVARADAEMGPENSLHASA